MAADTENLGTFALLGADRRVPGGAARHDVRDVGQGFDILYESRFAPHPYLRRVRWLQTRLATLAFERFDHRGLFAADISAGPAMHGNVQVKTTIEDILAQVAVLVGIGNRLDPRLTPRKN